MELGKYQHEGKWRWREVEVEIFTPLYLLDSTYFQYLIE